MEEKPNCLEDEVPDSVIDTLARCLLPKIQEFYESPEGQAELEKWKQEDKKSDENGPYSLE